MMNKLTIVFTGDVLDLSIQLEGEEVGLYFNGESRWSRTLKNFTITGSLQMVMLCKGLNGTAWELEITVNDETTKKYSGTIKNGYSRISDQIERPE